MVRSIRISLLLALFVTVPTLVAQSADPTGHWEGAIQAPGKEVKIEIDLARKDGKVIGTFGNPAANEKGIPIAHVTVEGASVKLGIKANGGGTFDGKLSPDGKSISGDFITEHGMSVEFSLLRTGDARIEPPKTSPPIAKALEGSWTGTLDVAGVPHEVGLKMENHPDGTSTGILIANDGLEIGITKIISKGSALTIEVSNVNGAYEGTLNAGGTELAGKWTQGTFTGPLNFHRTVTK